MGITIKQTQNNNTTVYAFTANNTDYEVLTADQKEFTVFSRHTTLTRWSTPKVYDTANQLASRSKAFNDLIKLIQH